MQWLRRATHDSKLLVIACVMTIIFDYNLINDAEINSLEISLYVIQLDNKKHPQHDSIQFEVIYYAFVIDLSQ